MVASQRSTRKFTYSESQLIQLKRGLSLDRFAFYLESSGGDDLSAVRLYEENTALSESLYGVLQGFEIVLRNSMHETLVRGIGQPDWYSHVDLEEPEMETVKKTKDKIKKKGYAVTSSRVVSELTFGFWSSLAARHYAARLWLPHLHKAFPYKQIGHKVAHKRLDSIRYLRNKVAHHECILRYDLEREYKEIIEACGWICPDTTMWIRETTRFETAYFLLRGKRITF